MADLLKPMRKGTLWRDGAVPPSNRREIGGALQHDPSPIVASRFLILHTRWPPSHLPRHRAGLVTYSPLIWIGAEHARHIRWSVLARFAGEFPVEHTGRARPLHPTRNDRE